MRFVPPRQNPSALLDSTRQLDPEEMAELQLEQGCADQALEIYERLLEAHPTNLSYRRRRDWLVRLGAVRPRPRPARAVPASALRPLPLARAGAEADASPFGTRPITSERPVTRVDTTLRGMQPPSESGAESGDGIAERPPLVLPSAPRVAGSEAARGPVRRLRIVSV